MSTCKTCGREEDGHWLGCAVAPEGATYDWRAGKEWNPLGETMKALTCSLDGCSELRRSMDKRVKFCEFHSDPKNRK